MAAFDFPSNPSNGQTYSANGIDWIYDGSVWKKDATAGVKGQKGEVGQKGQKGEVGEKGDKGDKGDKGQKGEIGATGGSGGTGQKGEKGQKGQDGVDATGTKGQKGEKGEIGPQGGTGGSGQKGQQGQKGEAGAAASKGQKGEVGATGSGGATGGQGQKGEPGSGTNGTDGDKGQKGDKGVTGGAGSSVPSGGIIMWSGSISNIPSGWELCNGQNGTPDLRNKFVVGAYSDGANGNTYPNLPPGNTGGSNVSSLVAHSHTINNHTHSFSDTVSASNHFHYTHYAGGQNGTSGTGGTGRLHNRAGDNVAAVTSSYSTGSDPRQDAEIGARSGNAANAGRSSNAGSHSHSVSGTTGNPSNRGTDEQGSQAGSKSNLPPYYALAYIMKT